MIYLTNTTAEQGASIPKPIADKGEAPYTLHLVSAVGMQEADVDVADSGESSLYYLFRVTLPPGLAAGEYVYEVMSDDAVKARGLLVLTESGQDTTEYGSTIEYEQYAGEEY